MEKPVKKEWNLQRSKKQIVLGYFLDALFYLLGSLAYAVAINVFSAPNNIAPGGFTGIATMLNYLLGLPIGVMTIALNLPLFIWGFIRLGKRAMVKTVIGTVLSSVVIDLTAPILPQYVCEPGEVMLAAFSAACWPASGWVLCSCAAARPEAPIWWQSWSPRTSNSSLSDGWCCWPTASSS